MKNRCGVYDRSSPPFCSRGAVEDRPSSRGPKMSKLEHPHENIFFLDLAGDVMTP